MVRLKTLSGNLLIYGKVVGQDKKETKAFRAKQLAQEKLKGGYNNSALKKGFKASGRDILGLDGCFMNGPYSGQILTVVGVDTNKGIYPVADAVVEAETKSSWKWELTGLPCKHGVAAIWNAVENGLNASIPEDWVHPCYRLKTWEIVYSYKINPLNGPSQAGITQSQRTNQVAGPRQVEGSSQGARRNKGTGSSQGARRFS
ncbi:mutator type transposase [Tanacetum coccineum]